MPLLEIKNRHARVAAAGGRHILKGVDGESRNRKCLGDGVTADFEYVPPLWELRVGEFRAFYEIDASDALVYVHAVRRKPPGLMTAEVLNENG